MSRRNIKDLPIGVFDSGIGGLTVVRAIQQRLPGETILYFGDTARTPYGAKSPETLVRFSLENARFLSKQKIKMLVVACNSSSAYCLPALRKELGVPVIGVIEPGARAAVGRQKRQHVGVIGTAATIRSGAYQAALKELEPSTRVSSAACPLFVPLVEEDWMNHSVTTTIAKEYLLPLKKKGIDTLVLGCTHYPLIKNVIRKVMGKGIAMVDSAQETAREVEEHLEMDNLVSSRKKVASKMHRFWVSDVPERFAKVGRRFLGHPMADVRHVTPKDLIGIERRLK